MVNFWKPGGGSFRALNDGEYFVFKAKAPINRVVGGGYLGVDPAYRLRVSPRLRGEFGNGEQFCAQAGQLIALPEHRIDRPQRELLEWHLDEVFKAS